jgi:hypothetical protein
MATIRVAWETLSNAWAAAIARCVVSEGKDDSEVREGAVNDPASTGDPIEKARTPMIRRADGPVGGLLRYEPIYL